MKKVDVKLKSLDILRTFPKEYALDIRLLINDGKDKELVKKIKLDDGAGAGIALLKEVREKVKKAHAGSASDDVLGGVVVVKLLDDDDVVVGKLTKFFSTVRDKMRVANLGKISYYDAEVQVKRTRVVF